MPMDTVNPPPPQKETPISLSTIQREFLYAMRPSPNAHHTLASQTHQSTANKLSLRFELAEAALIASSDQSVRTKPAAQLALQLGQTRPRHKALAVSPTPISDLI